MGWDVDIDMDTDMGYGYWILGILAFWHFGILAFISIYFYIFIYAPFFPPFLAFFLSHSLTLSFSLSLVVHPSTYCTYRSSFIHRACSHDSSGACCYAMIDDSIVSTTMSGLDSGNPQSTVVTLFDAIVAGP